MSSPDEMDYLDDFEEEYYPEEDRKFDFLPKLNPEGLCNKCSMLDLEQSFANAFALYEGARRGTNTRKLEVFRSGNGPAYLGHFHYVTSLGARLSQISFCQLCNFLKRTCPESGERFRLHRTYKLLAICSSESYLFEVPKKADRKRPGARPWATLGHNVFMAVVPEVRSIPKTGVPLRWFETDLPKIGSIYRLTQDSDNERLRIALPRMVSSKVSMDLPKLWLHCCRHAHKFCGPQKPTGASLPGFRAINCTRSPLVVEDRPWSEKYVALSYVWGPSTEDWPKTVLDAVVVTKQIGEQYLWVDRLCINQTNLQEKQFLISKMDAIYEGAEFTIIAAAGDARTGLTGVSTTTRKLQPLIGLKHRPRNVTPSVDPSIRLLGVTTDENISFANDGNWLDLHRAGLRSVNPLAQEDLQEMKKEREIREIFGISEEHFIVFKDMAEDAGKTIEEWMPNVLDMSEKEGVPIQEFAPYFLRKIATAVGMPEDMIKNLKRRPALPVTPSPIKEKPLPPGIDPKMTILISTMEDPRVTIRNSEWATRGWTYQEGVLSNCRLVFTDQQMYWECNGMATQESLDLIDLYDDTETRFSDYMLSGIFDGDIHRVPELQYGFKASDKEEEVSEQVLKLDGHIRAYTSRNLSYDGDWLNAFLGVGARYSTNNGLHLLLGMPVWAGLFANGNPGLQHTFALSVSSWTHNPPLVTHDFEMSVVNCPRRTQFPSWTWVGWKGQVEFSSNTAAGRQEDKPPGWEETVHVDFFKAMTSRDWVQGIESDIWSAEMLLHATDGSETTLLVGHAPVINTAVDQTKSWLLTIQDPFVLKNTSFMDSVVDGEWKRLGGKRARINLSVTMSESELTMKHRIGELITVLVFASRVPFIFDGMARFLILRKSDPFGTRWERIGRLLMWVDEAELNRYKGSARILSTLPVQKFGRPIVLV